MRKNALKLFALALACMVSLQSCLKNQTDYFDQSASERMKEVLNDMKTLLLKPENGWRMEYYIGNVDQDRGGRNVALKFFTNADSVQIMSEEKKDTMITSWYKLTSDDGPVLSFDTYNDVFHKYAVPSSSYYEARGGDFEFIIISYSEEKIVLKGKRSGRISTLYPLSEPMGEFIPRLAAKSRDFHVSSFTGELNGKKVKGSFDVRNHQFTIEEDIVPENDKVEIAKETFPYIITEEGIHFYEKYEFLGGVLSDIKYDKTDTTLVGSGLTAKGYIPDDWRPYSFFPGKYMFTHGKGSFTVEVTAYGEEEEMFRVSGVSDLFDIFFGYDIRSGRMTLEAQLLTEKDKETVVKEGKDYVILVPLSTKNSFGTDSENGFSAAWNKNETSPKFTWGDKGLTPGFITEEFYLRLYNGGYVRDDSGSTVAPRVYLFKDSSGKNTLNTFLPVSMSKYTN